MTKEDTSSSLHLPPIPLEFIDITYKCIENGDDAIGEPITCILPFASSALHQFPIKEARILTSGEGVKTVIEISLDNKEAALLFNPGDTIGVLAQNSLDEVNYIITRLNLTNESHKEYTISLKEAGGKKKPILPAHLPLKSSISYVLQKCLDIRSVLKKVLINALSTYTTDSVEKRQLETLSSREGAQLYTEQILNKNTSLLDILAKYPSCNPPITLLMQHLPRLMPRPYSICNSSLVNKDVIKICFSVVNTDAKKKGIVTGWLEYLTKSSNKLNGASVNDIELVNGASHKDENSICLIDDRLSSLYIGSNGDAHYSEKQDDKIVSAYLRKSNTFCLPSDQSKPIVMIALGTGLAPFIGFLEERQYLRKKNSNLSFGKSVLYFGCRYAEKDFIFKNKLDAFVSDGTLSKLVVSHSRENSHSLKYVQDGLRSDTHSLVNLIWEENAVTYICGDINKISKEITECLTNCFVKEKNFNLEEANRLIKELKSDNRFIQDAWS